MREKSLDKNDLERDHSYITSANDWVGGSKKMATLLTFTIYADSTPLEVGGSEKAQNYDDVFNIWTIPKDSRKYC